MNKRTDLNWGGGSASVICDIEDLRKEKIVYFFNYEQELDQVHQLYGGENYYCSRSGLSGAGYAYLPPYAFLVNTYHPRNRYVTRQAKAIQLTNFPYDKNLFLSVYFPVNGHDPLENDAMVYIVLQYGHREDFGNADLEQALFVTGHDEDQSHITSHVGKVLHEIVERANSLDDGDFTFEDFVTDIGEAVGLDRQPFTQSYFPSDETRMTYKYFPVWAADWNHIPRWEILNFLDTRFMYPKKEEISQVHSALSIYRVEIRGYEKDAFGVFARDGRMLYAYWDDPLLHGFHKPATDQVIPVERYWDTREIISFDHSTVKVLAVAGKEKVFCMAFTPVHSIDRTLLKLPDDDLYWEYEEEVSLFDWGYDYQGIADRLKKAVLETRRKVMRDAIATLRQNKKTSDFIDANPERVITLEDSLKAGNCRYGTESFRDRYFPGRESVTLEELKPYVGQLHVANVVRSVMAATS